MHRWLCALGVTCFGIAVIAAQDGLKSGPQAGTVLPAAFDALNINGKVAEGRQHCLICQNALHPAVLIFAKEPTEKSAKAVGELLDAVDKLVQKHERIGLNGFAVILSPDARSSVTVGERDATSTEELIEEATKRNELVARLKKQAEPLKNVIVAAYPLAGPKSYNVNPKAEVTVVYFSRLRVKANWAFEEGKLTDTDIAAIVKMVDEESQKAAAAAKDN